MAAVATETRVRVDSGVFQSSTARWQGSLSTKYAIKISKLDASTGKAVVSPTAKEQLRKVALANCSLQLAHPTNAGTKKTAAQEHGVTPASARRPSETTTHPLPPPPRLHMGMFEVGKPLGKGKFGRVYLVRHRPSGFVSALKVLDVDQITREGAENHVRREIEIHSNLKHPGVLGFYNWFYDAKRIYLILEFAAGGELFKTLRREGSFAEHKAAKYVAQVAASLRYLHSKNVMHRDIKPENILIGLHGELKLADFGYSVHSTRNRRDTLCGTLDYLPPEMLKSKKIPYSNAVDQWSLGVLTYEFLTGEAPFEDSPARTQSRIARNDMKPLPASISASAKDFVGSLLVLDPSRRLSLDGALLHPWIVRHQTTQICHLRGRSSRGSSSAVSYGLHSRGHSHSNASCQTKD